MKKKKGDMTFQEFWEEEKKKGEDSETLEKEKQGILETLRKEGFSDQQINKMKIKKVLDLMWSATEKQSKAMKDSVFQLMEQSITAFYSLETFLKKGENWKLLQTDKGLRKDLFELASGFADLETTLHDTEDRLREGLEELKKKLEEKRKQKKE